MEDIILETNKLITSNLTPTTVDDIIKILNIELPQDRLKIPDDILQYKEDFENKLYQVLDLKCKDWDTGEKESVLFKHYDFIDLINEFLIYDFYYLLGDGCYEANQVDIDELFRWAVKKHIYEDLPRNFIEEVDRTRQEM